MWIGIERGDARKVGGVAMVSLRPVDRVVRSERSIGSQENPGIEGPESWAPIDVRRRDEDAFVFEPIPGSVGGSVPR